jgi:XTP/dITP diphosphohydrolase
MQLVAATHNAHKLKEIDAITAPFGFTLIPKDDVGLADVDVEETGATFEENSYLKAAEICRLSGKPAIADDSGLMVDALNGEPGVYSARYGGKDSDAARTAYLLENMAQVPEEERTARFVSAIACALPDGRVVTSRGTCEGRILFETRGDNGFGYDPVFYVPEIGMTFAEADGERKNAISHRGNALKEFCKAWKEAGLC